MVERWKLSGLERIGGHDVTVFGSPVCVKDEESIEFNGINDGIIVLNNPLSGADNFTLEVIFKPKASSDPSNIEQRFIHIQNTINENSRVLIELRLTEDNNWFLDTFIKSDDSALTLHAEKFPHPIGNWYHAALVYENGMMKHFVNGIEEMSGSIEFEPINEGHTSIGMRINQVSWFKGFIKIIRATKKALKPEEFLRI